MHQHVFVVHQGIGSREVTNGALVHHQLWMALLVFLEFNDIVKTLTTGGTTVQQFRGMFFFHVVLYSFSIHVTFVTQVASEWLVVVVFDEMALDVVFSGEALRAQCTLVGFVTSVKPHVTLHIIATSKGVVAHQAGVNIMLIQIVGLKRWTIRQDLKATFALDILNWLYVWFRSFAIVNVSRYVLFIILH